MRTGNGWHDEIVSARHRALISDFAERKPHISFRRSNV